VSPDVAVFHDRIKLPVGADRDLVIDMRRSFDQETRVLEWRFKGVERKDAPVCDGCVRMAALEGSWRFVPAEKGGADATYVVYSDPGGDFPRAMVSNTQADAALKRLRSVLEDAKKGS
jgi:hypothetical protein